MRDGGEGVPWNRREDASNKAIEGARSRADINNRT